ncbi:hypothetical protein [Gordonia humi]|uniref:Uncharacterized protein n=1 Tax=Gordonia humi TaxID=686429 RepID=A0A840F0B2_9ACTN|nr:hypothetical protein [Gordonia humi]MBB4137312.1 hypothetical protein [Gordonia humi]
MVRNSVRAGIVCAAAAVTVALGAPGPAAADPAPSPAVPGAPAPETQTPAPDAPSSDPAAPATDGQAPTLSGIPGDAELAELLRTLKASGGADEAVEALSSILGSQGQLDPSSLLSSLGLDGSALDGLLPNAPSDVAPTPGDPETTGAPAPTDPVVPDQVAADAAVPAAGDDLGTLQRLTGTQMLSPAIAPFCAAPTDDNPLGVVTAPVVAAPGPWPNTETGLIGDLLTGSGADRLLKLADPAARSRLQAVDKGETAYALVAPSKTGSDQLQVAWFNTSTLQGGMEPLKPISDDPSVGQMLKAITAGEDFSGVRLAQAATGEGTVLSAVFGTTSSSGRTCYFLPALGAVKN